MNALLCYISHTARRLIEKLEKSAMGIYCSILLVLEAVAFVHVSSYYYYYFLDVRRTIFIDADCKSLWNISQKKEKVT